MPELSVPSSQNFVIAHSSSVIEFITSLRMISLKICDSIVFVCTRMVRQVSRNFHGGSWGPDHEAVSNLYLILKSAL